MQSTLDWLCTPGAFMPHGQCYLWTPGIVWLHVVSDALIALAYFSIPVSLLRFVRQRRDAEFRGVYVCFAAFVLACGTTHLLEIWNVWHAHYWLSGGAKAKTLWGVSVVPVDAAQVLSDGTKPPVISRS